MVVLKYNMSMAYKFSIYTYPTKKKKKDPPHKAINMCVCVFVCNIYDVNFTVGRKYLEKIILHLFFGGEIFCD